MQANYSNLVELFVSIAETYPQRIAIKDCYTSYTYAQLYAQGASVAGVLAGNHIKPGQRVVCISRKDTGSIICFWGILLSGAIPVMLDQEDGYKSNMAKINSVKPAAIILDKGVHSREDFGNISLFDFQDILSADRSFQHDNIVYPEVCYILLTSGTTGSPKAVQVAHQGVLHYTFAVYDRLGTPEKINAAHVSTFAADLGLTNFFMALVSGGMLRILNKTESTDPVLFNSMLEEDQLSFLKITPSHLTSLIAHREKPYHRTIDTIVVGGEKLTWEAVKTIFATGICSNLYNHYGPTETTIGATMFRVDTSSLHFDKTLSVPIGAPLGNIHCLLKDAKGNTGELYIGGPAVSMGYLDNPTDNERKFVTSLVDGKEMRFYRTGDICEKLPDGNYEFLYRTDRQVKVKGYRIELGEVEQVVLGHHAIENALAAVSVDHTHQILEIYIKLKNKEKLPKESLRSWLADRLPGYKIPSNFYFYTDTPYNSNGKIDLRALKQQFKSETESPVQEKEINEHTSWKELVEACWKQLLLKNNILDTDNFFEAGGDSLQAIQLIGKLQRFGYKVHITDLNNHPTFGAFAGITPVRLAAGDESQVKPQEIRRLTLSQYQLINHKKYDLDEYCQAILLDTSDSINVRTLALALNLVLDAHAQLATPFRKRTALFVTEKQGNAGLELGTTILNDKVSIISQIQTVTRGLLKGINIEGGKLFVAHVFVDPGGKDYLYLACHHLVVDVISWNIIIDELLDFYDQIENGKQPIVARENAVYQFYKAVADIKPDLTLFEGMTAPEIFRLPRMAQGIHTGELPGVYNLLIPDELSEVLLHLNEQQQSSMLNGYLLSAFGDALLEECGMPAITVDVEYHGRPQREDLPDLSRSVAWWATTMPINIIKERLSPGNCAALIESGVVWANNINLLNSRFAEIKSSGADVLFNYLGHFPEQFGHSSLRMKPSCFNPGATRSWHAQQEYKLHFTARFIGKSLIIDAQFDVETFTGSSQERIVKNFYRNLKRSLPAANQHFDDLPLMMLKSNQPTIGQPLHHLNFKQGLTKTSAKKTVFLTGATGFLGIHLLQELIRNENVYVYCLVRGASQAIAEERLEDCLDHYTGGDTVINKDNIRVINGDLLLDNFGLKKSVYDSIAQDTDIILHAAADINLLKNYAGLVLANIHSTRQITKLAVTGRQKSVHYVSTLAVSGFSPDGSFSNFSEDDFERGQFFMSDYEKTKFEAEKIIREFFGQGGKGKIYRVGHIAADSVNGKFQRNIDQNRIFQIIKGAILLKQLPYDYCEEVSFSYVDIVAKSIANSCLDKIVNSRSCLHVENAHYMPFTRIAAMLQQSGYDLELVDPETFKASVANYHASMADKNTVYLMNNWIERFMNKPRCIHYQNRYSLDILAQSGLIFPATTPEWFAAMMKQGVKAGYFHSPAAGANTVTNSKIAVKV